MGSTRFPNKVMRPVCGTPMIGLLLERLQHARSIDEIIVATSVDPRNDTLEQYVRQLGYQVYRGSENDVLDRYFNAAKSAQADVVVRATGDCPLIDPGLVDDVIGFFESRGVDYASNVDPPTYPDGLDIEVFSFTVLEEAWLSANEPRQREHVTPFIREGNRFTRANYANTADESGERWTVDEPEDFEIITRVFEHFHPRRDFRWTEVAALRRSHPDWFMTNR